MLYFIKYSVMFIKPSCYFLLRNIHKSYSVFLNSPGIGRVNDVDKRNGFGQIIEQLSRHFVTFSHTRCVHKCYVNLQNISKLRSVWMDEDTDEDDKWGEWGWEVWWAMMRRKMRRTITKRTMWSTKIISRMRRRIMMWIKRKRRGGWGW